MSRDVPARLPHSARITIARNTQKISLLEFRKQLEETIADAEKTYWQLVQAEREVKIQEELLSRSIETAIRLLNRRDLEVTRVQISQTNSRVERRRAVLIDAKARVQDLSDQLKRDMNDPDLPITSRVAQLGECYQPFATEVRSLAEGFKMKKLRHWLESLS